ncbi:MAG: DUF1232 domain-containing protein [Spirochaetales bacterium]|nr:DUF1232 domain-containing protein [Spirochaetales bacterium]
MKKQKKIRNYSEDKMIKELKKKEKKAEKLLENAQGFDRILIKIDLKISKTIQFLQEVIEDLKLLFELVKDVVRQKYKEIPVGSVIIVTGALLYFLTPLDIAPDFIPVIGFTDDVSVILLVIKQIQTDLDNYKKWRKKNRKKRK